MEWVEAERWQRCKKGWEERTEEFLARPLLRSYRATDTWSSQLMVAGGSQV